MKLSRKFISATADMCDFSHHVPAPYLRRRLKTEKQVACAKISVCGLGFYRFWLDGCELTRGFLSPYISNPNDIMDYDVYDITDRLTEGEHVLGFQLGNGMQNSFGGYVWDFEKAAWRSAPKLAVCLSVTYTDGTSEEIEADEAFVCAPSPILFDELRHGEIYDARLEIPEWNTVGFDDSAWSAAIAAEMPSGRSVVCQARPIVRTFEQKPISITPDKTIRYGRFPDIVHTGWLYLFPENCSGIARLKIKGTPGQKITMIFGEHIDRDGTPRMDNIRFVDDRWDNWPLYIQSDTYICKGGGEETWEPVFTYHGFRFVLVMGITAEQATEDLLTYVVMNTDLPERGNFSCSDEIANKLQRIVRVATLANFFHIPTDCPHREKNGWTADASLSAEHTLLNLSPEDNYREWLSHISATQNADGMISDIVPTGGWGMGLNPAWDIVLFHIPYMQYRYRGDKKIIENNIDAMWNYFPCLLGTADADGLIPYGLGDWCAPKHFAGFVDNRFTSTIMAVEMCRMGAFMFDLCGQSDRAGFCRETEIRLRDNIRRSCIDFDRMIVTAFFDPDVPVSQTAQAMAIYYDIFEEDEKPQAYARMVEEIHRQNDHLDTGVLGARVLFHVLTQFGDSDLAYRVITVQTPPSYGALIAAGNTALTESFYIGDADVNSRNHHFFGDISAWFIKAICGINYNPDADDLTRADITPHFITDLDHAEAFHVTPHGKISVRWERTGDGEITLTVDYPAALHGVLKFNTGWVCAACGKTETDAKSGIFKLKKI